MREREVKMIVPGGVEMPSAETLMHGVDALWAADEFDQDATYFDTTDLALSRAGASVRYRSDDGWTVKLPQPSDGATTVRDEYGFTGSLDAVPDAAASLVRALTRSRPLVEVAHVHTTRRRLLVLGDNGAHVLEVDDDDVTATVPGAPTTHFHEVEVESGPNADPEFVRHIVKRLRKAGADSHDSCPKIVRALGVRAREAPDLPSAKTPTTNASGAELVRAAIANGAERLIKADPFVRLGDDPEAVHDARVATRRLRSDLRTFRPILDATWSEPLRGELRWLSELLGRVRDADVLLAHLVELAEALPDTDHAAADALLGQLRQLREQDRAELLQALNSERYAALLDRLVTGARDPRMDQSHHEADDVRKLLRHPERRLRKAIKHRAAHPDPSELHDIRKRAKQLRYGLEALAPVTGKKERVSIKRLVDLQDVLGEHHDVVVAAAWLRDAGIDSGEPAQAFVAGRLTGACDCRLLALHSTWVATLQRLT